jgi:type IV pilus assembly protein PilO
MASLFQSATRMAASSSRAESSRTHSRLQGAVAILLVANGVLLFFLFRSPGLTATERQSEISRLETEQRAVQARVQHLTDLRKKVQDATQNEQKFAQVNFLPRSSAFSKMLTDLERLATENRLQPTDSSYRPDSNGNNLGWTDVEVSLSFEGDYADLVRFLNRLEQSNLFWIVEGMDVSGQQGQKLRLNMQAATYLLPS